MTTRRWIALALLVVLAVAVAPPSSRAQIPMIAQGIVHATVASVNSANTTTETLLYQYRIPAALVASWTTSNTAFGTAPLHLRLNGGIRTLGSTPGPTATLGVNLLTSAGTQVATFTIINGNSLASDYGAGTACGGAAQGIGACFAPVSVDVYLSPIATVTTQNCTDLRPCNQALYMAGRFSAATTTQANVFTYASESVFNAATLAQGNVTNQDLIINVLWRWGAAASANSLNIYNGVLKLGF